jgi:hypothetical protein
MVSCLHYVDGAVVAARDQNKEMVVEGRKGVYHTTEAHSPPTLVIRQALCVTSPSMDTMPSDSPSPEPSSYAHLQVLGLTWQLQLVALFL